MASTSVTPNDQDTSVNPLTQHYCNYTSSGCTKAVKIGYFFFFTPMCLVGIVFNFINVLVLTGTKFKLKGSTFTYLTAMAFADLTTLVLAWPYGIMSCTSYNHTWQLYFQNVYIFYIIYPILNSSATASIWMTVAVSVERYISIGKTFLSTSLCSRLHAKKTIFLIAVCSVAINSPFFFYRRVSPKGEVSQTDWAKSDGYTVYTWCRLFLVKLIPIAMNAVFNTLLIKSVWDANKKRKSLVCPSNITNESRRQKMQTRTTVMSITLSVIFMLCNTLEPFVHSGVYASLFGTCSVYTDTYAFLRSLANTLEMCSFATNFVIYCFFNKQFAVALTKKFNCDGNSVQETSTTMYTIEGTTIVRP